MSASFVPLPLVNVDMSEFIESRSPKEELESLVKDIPIRSSKYSWSQYESRRKTFDKKLARMREEFGGEHRFIVSEPHPHYPWPLKEICPNFVDFIERAAYLLYTKVKVEVRRFGQFHQLMIVAKALP